ncbi:hypothetical protein WMY93_014510 [Mugilogobius chulae]|uniref:Uncharacterized protein n=1 Tax=Mugilogobius chulae TaxID=88201 RepID=A0AAW0NUP1_9GOBI
MPAPTTVNGNSAHRHTPKSPCLTPSTMVQPAEPTRQAHNTHERASQPDGAADNSRDFQQVEDYPDREYTLPLTAPDSYRTDKKQDDTLLMPSYSSGTLPFDPYPLLYGPQLLAYPYNLAALPVALNMMAPGGDKVEPLPFLPAIFNYATGPYMGAAPHPLVANTTLYSNGSSGGKKQRDSTSKP